MHYRSGNQYLVDRVLVIQFGQVVCLDNNLWRKGNQLDRRIIQRNG
jgi:hypothetical protein